MKKIAFTFSIIILSFSLIIAESSEKSKTGVSIINQNRDECSDLTQDECTASEFCDWTIVQTPNGVFEMCVDAGGWNDDGGWDDGDNPGPNPCSDFGQEDCEWFDECVWTDDGCQDYDWNDDSGDDGEWESECSDLTQDECTESEFCNWTIVETPNGVFEMCVESGDWNDDGGEWESECTGLSFEDCESLDFCNWIGNSDNPDSWGMCIEAGDWNDDGGEWESECTGLSFEDCESLDFCNWIGNSDNPDSWGMCIEAGDWNDDGGEWESECTGLSFEDCESLDFCNWIGNSDNPDSWGMCIEAGDWNDDGGEWESECTGLSFEDCESLDFCNWIGNSDDPNSWGMCVEAGDWNDDGGDDGWSGCEDLGYQECQMMEDCQWVSDTNDPNSTGSCVEVGLDDGGWESECSDLTQDECVENLECDWSVVATPQGVFEMCIESGGWNDDGGWDDCDPYLECAAVLTCYDGFWYPTSCGPFNCDLPLYPCNEEDNCAGLSYDECIMNNDCDWISDSDDPTTGGGFCIDDDVDNGPPECLLDCEGIEDINPNEDPYEACDWIISFLGFDPGFGSCTQDCDDETMIQIDEIVEACYECLQNEDFDCADVFSNDDCSDLSMEECVDAEGCEPNYNANGQFEYCDDNDNHDDGCFDSAGNFYSLGSEMFINDCEYYECTLNGFVGPYTLDECGEGGDDGGIPFETILKIGEVVGVPGQLIEVPLYYVSEIPLAGIQFTIADSPDWVTGVELVSHVDCFEANSNDVNGSLIGIFFSFQGCELEPAANGFHFATILYEINSDDISSGSLIELNFNEAIVSNPEGEGVPVDTFGGSILLSLLGDNTSDGEVNVLDIVSLINFILLFNEPDEYQFWASDMNGDNSLNVLDVVLLVDLILDINP